MKHLFLALAAFAASPAFAGTTYIVNVTNAGNMPLSPGLFYSATEIPAGRKLGEMPSGGFVQLCQTGNPANRAMELKANHAVGNIQQTMGLIMPGESRSVEVEVGDIQKESIFFELMYGKSKDACAVAQITPHNLVALKQHVTTEVVGRDSAIQTGAFAEPSVANGSNYLDAALCNSATDAISCLRELSQPTKSAPRVRFFSAYMPSLLTQLEMKYGTADVRSLVIPEAGAVSYQIKLKH